MTLLQPGIPPREAHPYSPPRVLRSRSRWIRSMQAATSRIVRQPSHIHVACRSCLRKRASLRRWPAGGKACPSLISAWPKQTSTAAPCSVPPGGLLALRRWRPPLHPVLGDARGGTHTGSLVKLSYNSSMCHQSSIC